jgi:hypothetical protein
MVNGHFVLQRLRVETCDWWRWSSEVVERQISFQQFLRAGLAASRLVGGPQSGSGQIRAAEKATLADRGYEPVVGFTADVGASGSRAFYGDDQVRVARFGHRQASDWMTKLGKAMAERKCKIAFRHELDFG